MNFFQKLKLIYKLKKTKKGPIIFLTGSGISAESGIPTFRDKNGLWHNFSIDEVCRPESFLKNPKLVIDFYNERRISVFSKNIHPNDAHFEIASLENELKDVYVITQNIDNLHELSGSKNIFHIHGSLFKNKCHECRTIEYSVEKIEFPNKCNKCFSVNKKRPDVVFFKEKPYFMEETLALLKNTKIFIQIGTSGMVYPAAQFKEIAHNSGALTIEINIKKEKEDKYTDFFLKGLASKETLFLINLIKKYMK